MVAVKPKFFLAGFSKCATTWMWKCLYEHPQIFVPETDIIHYFNTQYYRGEEWYLSHFSKCTDELVVGDTTPQYAKSEVVVDRIAKYSPDAKIILMMRNPVDRTWSHYIHEWRKGYTGRTFQSIPLDSDVFNAWIGTGFYDQHISQLLSVFPPDSMHYIIYDDICDAPEAVLRQTYEFLNVDPTFIPCCTHTIINGRPRSGSKVSIWNTLTKALRTNSDEDVPQMTPELNVLLSEMYAPHTDWLENFLGKKLVGWK